MPDDFASLWSLDPAIAFLNHGSYGATPQAVLDAQTQLRTQMEREPVRFMGDELEPLLDHARMRLARLLQADPDDLAFVPNATTAVNTVLRSLNFEPGDEILATDHDYNACLNAVRVAAEETGAQPVVVPVAFPAASPDEVLEHIIAAVTPRTRLAVISHFTSPTALVLPIERIVRALTARDVDTLVDGAHAVMVPTDLTALGAAYYTGNLHKWLSAPKGSAFLHVRSDRQSAIRPLVISHGANAPGRGRSLFRLEFDWTGTADPTAYLAVPAAIDFFDGLFSGGWDEAAARNRELVLSARRRLLEVFPQTEPAPESMIGCMASIELPLDLPPIPLPPADGASDFTTWPVDPLHDFLLRECSIEVPVYAWPHTPADGPRRRLLRFSAQLYNSMSQYERLADALGERLARR